MSKRLCKQCIKHLPVHRLSHSSVTINTITGSSWRILSRYRTGQQQSIIHLRKKQSTTTSTSNTSSPPNINSSNMTSTPTTTQHTNALSSDASSSNTTQPRKQTRQQHINTATTTTTTTAIAPTSIPISASASASASSSIPSFYPTLLRSFLRSPLVRTLLTSLGYLHYNRSVTLYNKIHQQCIHVEWHQYMKIPHDFGGYISLIVLHMWIIHIRFRMMLHPHSTVSQKDIQRYTTSLWHYFYDELESSIVKQTNTMVYRKQLADIQAGILGTCFAYDTALQCDDVNQGDIIFIGAMWRDIYRADQQMNKNLLKVLYEYVIDNLHYLIGLNDTEFLLGHWSFLAPPHQRVPLSNDYNFSMYQQKIIDKQMKKTI